MPRYESLIQYQSSTSLLVGFARKICREMIEIQMIDRVIEHKQSRMQACDEMNISRLWLIELRFRQYSTVAIGHKGNHIIFLLGCMTFKVTE